VSGLVAALILAVSRAVGETMVVFIAAGAGGSAVFNMDPLEKGLTMTAAMASQASGTDAVVGEALTFQSLFFVGSVLFIITLLLNLAADRFVRRVRQKY
jgi:phosphate transport system permease protein